MQYITGRVVVVEDKKTIINTNDRFSMVIFVIKKRMKKKVRNIAFKTYGNLAEKILSLRINDKIEVEYLIDCQQSSNPNYKGDWFTTLQAISVERAGTRKKIIEEQLKIKTE